MCLHKSVVLPRARPRCLGSSKPSPRVHSETWRNKLASYLLSRPAGCWSQSFHRAPRPHPETSSPPCRVPPDPRLWEAPHPLPRPDAHCHRSSPLSQANSLLSKCVLTKPALKAACDFSCLGDHVLLPPQVKCKDCGAFGHHARSLRCPMKRWHGALAPQPLGSRKLKENLEPRPQQVPPIPRPSSQAEREREQRQR